MPLHQYDYLFAIGTIFAALDAYNIGANDVANSFATSVSSKSLKMWQACVAAAIFEFLGAVTVGARVSGTIKNGIVPLSIFRNDPGVGLLAFTVAIVCSASWLMLATRMSWPVSTTYSIVSAVTGVGIAVGGIRAPAWGWNDSKGIAAVLAGLVIAPALAAAFAALLYLLVKYVVLKRDGDKQVRWALWTTPFLFWLVGSVCTMSIIFKGAPNLGLDDLPKMTFDLAVVFTGVILAVLAAIFWVPYVHAKVVKKDYTLRFYHIFVGPALWFRAPPADAGAEGKQHVVDYRVRKDEDDTVHPDNHRTASVDEESAPEKTVDSIEEEHQQQQEKQLEAQLAAVDETPSIWQSWKAVIVGAPRAIYAVFKHGIFYDIHARKNDDASLRAQAYVKQFPNETEACYSFVQVFTACVNSFAHGANDIGNAVGPYSAIYAIWSTAQPLQKNSPTPVWVLAAAAGFLVLGLATYGYNIMRILGTKITLISPSRGACMELGSAITVILASQYGIPVSTTMCITGALVGVGLMNGNVKAVNWKSIGYIYIGWIGTMIVVAIASYCLMAIILNAPHFPEQQ